MGSSHNVHIARETDVGIECCSYQTINGTEPPYPVLRIGDVYVYPTTDQLRRIRDVIDAYLKAHAAESAT
jgi:hypothetical protein